MIARQFIDNGYPVSTVLGLLELPRSSYYYKPSGTTGRGRKCSNSYDEGQWKFYKQPGGGQLAVEPVGQVE